MIKIFVAPIISFIMLIISIIISPRYFLFFEKLLNLKLYYGGNVFNESTWSLKGIALMLIISETVFIFTLIMVNLIVHTTDLVFYYFIINMIILISYNVGVFFRSDIFINTSPDEFKPTTLKDGKIEYGAIDYHLGHYEAMSVIISALFTGYGLILLIQGHLNILVLIGFPLQLLLLFPDKLNKIWPIDLKSKNGFRLLYLFIILLIIITMFILNHFTSMGVNLFDISF